MSSAPPTHPAETPKVPKAKGIDRQDVLLVVGLVSLIGGIWCWSKPLAAVVFGVLCLASVFLIERAEGARKEKK